MDGLWKLVLPFVLASLASLACGGGGDDDISDSPTSSPNASVLGATSGDATDVENDSDPCVPQMYEVESGDTLSQIAEEFSVTVVAIAGASDLANPDLLEVGQELTIPCLGSSDNAGDTPSENATASPTPEP